MTRPGDVAWSDAGILDLVMIASGQVDPRAPAYRNLPLIAPDHIESGTGRLLAVRTAAEQGAISGKYLVEPGDVIYSKIRPYLRKAHLATFPALCSADMYPLRPKAGVDPVFVLNTILSESFTSFAVSASMRSGIPKINRGELGEYRLRTPSTDEQAAIGGVLADVDQSVVALEQLIAKKRDIKQGMMQQLLGQASGPSSRSLAFQERRLDDVAVKIQDGTHFSPVVGGTDYRYVTSRNIGRGVMRLDQVETVSATEHRKIYARCDPRFGDLLLTKDGANTGNVALNPFREEISLLSSVAFIRCDPRRAVEGYLLQYLLSEPGRQQLKDAMAGNAITRLTLAKIRNLVVPLPPVGDQHAIATALSDADAEIASLERFLDKARAIKTGIMQELLTGRTRLPVAAAS